MTLAPFGYLPEGLQQLKSGLFTPMYEWPGEISDYHGLMKEWLSSVENTIWPSFENGQWIGDAKDTMLESSAKELEIAVELYHGGGSQPDILTTNPKTPASTDGKARNHEWHYKVEDAMVIDAKFLYLPTDNQTPTLDFMASSGGPGANYLIYEPGVDITLFRKLFWGRMRGLQPALFDIKEHFQRPRPWTVATAIGVENFRWTAAGNFTHTGIHPSILSGHCIQGILGGCAAFDAWLDESAVTGVGLSYERLFGLQRYMVEWGDRRVFAGVHYMSDNIASWTLARRLIPYLFRNSKEVENFAVQAIIGQSTVFQHIVEEFSGPLEKARNTLLSAFPEEQIS